MRFNSVTEKKMVPYLRHGDLLIKRVDKMPSALKQTKTDILAYGEATGHHHRLVGKQVQVFEDASGQKFFELEHPAELVHEEHKTLHIEEGKYAVVQEQEFDPFQNLIRRTVD